MQAARGLPSNVDVERALLGTILLTNQAFYKVADFLQPHHFYEPVNGLIYMAMQTLLRDNKQVNTATLKTVVEDYELVTAAGGMRYLQGLPSYVVTTINSLDYGKIIQDCWMRREMIEAAEAFINDAYSPPDMDTTPLQIVEAHENKLLKLVAGVEGSEGGLVNFRNALESTYTEWDLQSKGAQGIPTGFPDLDKLLGGLHPTDLIIVGARAAMGKSSLAVNIAFNTSLFFRGATDLEHRKKQVAFFSLEMSTEQLAGRVITGQTSLIAPRNRWGDPMSSDEFGRAMEMTTRYGDLPFWIDDSAEMSLSRLRARCIRLHRRKPLGLIIIDYLQIMAGETKTQDKRLEQLAVITRGLKRLAKDLKVPVVALSQLSRAVESREDHRPTLSDLRESGTIEQDSDIVLFPYRAEYYLRLAGDPVRRGNETNEQFSTRSAQFQAALAASADNCEVIVAKQRHGPLGSANLFFDKKRTWFESKDKQSAPDPQIEML